MRDQSINVVKVQVNAIKQIIVSVELFIVIV